MSPIVYLVAAHGQVVAQCNTWEAKTAALRLLFGTSLMLPPHVVTYEVTMLPCNLNFTPPQPQESHHAANR